MNSPQIERKEHRQKAEDKVRESLIQKSYQTLKKLEEEELSKLSKEQLRDRKRQEKRLKEEVNKAMAEREQGGDFDRLLPGDALLLPVGYLTQGEKDFLRPFLRAVVQRKYTGTTPLTPDQAAALEGYLMTETTRPPPGEATRQMGASWVLLAAGAVAALALAKGVHVAVTRRGIIGRGAISAERIPKRIPRQIPKGRVTTRGAGRRVLSLRQSPNVVAAGTLGDPSRSAWGDPQTTRPQGQGTFFTQTGSGEGADEKRVRPPSREGGAVLFTQTDLATAAAEERRRGRKVADWPQMTGPRILGGWVDSS
eukprot:180124-Prorocentrum_minimum.AAC.7